MPSTSAAQRLGDVAVAVVVAEVHQADVLRVAVGVGVAVAAARVPGVLDPEGVLAGDRIVARRALRPAHVRERAGVDCHRYS